MNVLKTNKSGVIKYFPELQQSKNWWPVIPKDNVCYYVFFRDNTPKCFCGVEHKQNRKEIHGLWASKQNKDATAVFELCNYINYLFLDYDIKVYVINDIALFAWQRCGFIILKSKKMKYWTGYWMERRAINGKTEN